jgi:GTP-binding protein HflX
MCEALDAGVVIFDHELSPRQIANIEKTLGVKVLDRSELILDIFASRATTHAAKLQVEIAQLEYTYPRLRAMWDHLERIVGSGGIGGIGTRGPGEQQLEIDRRIVQRKLTQLKRELGSIEARKAREVKSRNDERFTVGLVGYTNAGKSTLFNALTEGGAHASDRLFATLMTRTREWDLGQGRSAMLSDTVGFVRDLPPHLVASFKATLDETVHADLLLIVLDVSDPAARLHYETVTETLDELFEREAKAAKRAKEQWRAPERVLLLNKVDKLRDNVETLLWLSEVPGALAISAKGLSDDQREALESRVRRAMQGEIRERLLTLPMSESRAVSTIERRAEVLDRAYENGSVTLRARIGDRQLAELRASGARVEVREPA